MPQADILTNGLMLLFAVPSAMLVVDYGEGDRENLSLSELIESLVIGSYRSDKNCCNGDDSVSEDFFNVSIYSNRAMGIYTGVIYLRVLYNWFFNTLGLKELFFTVSDAICEFDMDGTVLEEVEVNFITGITDDNDAVQLNVPSIYIIMGMLLNLPKLVSLLCDALWFINVSGSFMVDNFLYCLKFLEVVSSQPYSYECATECDMSMSKEQIQSLLAQHSGIQIIDVLEGAAVVDIDCGPENPYTIKTRFGDLSCAYHFFEAIELKFMFNFDNNFVNNEVACSDLKKCPNDAGPCTVYDYFGCKKKTRTEHIVRLVLSSSVSAAFADLDDDNRKPFTKKFRGQGVDLVELTLLTICEAQKLWAFLTCSGESSNSEPDSE